MVAFVFANDTIKALGDQLLGECPGCNSDPTPAACAVIHGCCKCCAKPNPCKTEREKPKDRNTPVKAEPIKPNPVPVSLIMCGKHYGICEHKYYCCKGKGIGNGWFCDTCDDAPKTFL